MFLREFVLERHNLTGTAVNRRVERRRTFAALGHQHIATFSPAAQLTVLNHGPFLQRNGLHSRHKGPCPSTEGLAFHPRFFQEIGVAVVAVVPPAVALQLRFTPDFHGDYGAFTGELTLAALLSRFHFGKI